jgi:hypothetical protein
MDYLTVDVLRDRSSLFNSPLQHKTASSHDPNASMKSTILMFSYVPIGSSSQTTYEHVDVLLPYKQPYTYTLHGSDNVVQWS